MFYCSISIAMIFLSVMKSWFVSSFHVINPLSRALGGLCSVILTLPEYLNIYFYKYQARFDIEIIYILTS